MRLALAMVGLLLWPAAVQAQAAQRRDEEGIRFKAQLQAGAQLFPGSASRLLGAGVAYGVVVAWQPRWFVGVELGYEGANYTSRQPPDGPEIALFENGAQAVYKVSPRYGYFEPYALGGIGISVLTVTSKEGLRPKIDENTMVKVPMGLGFDFHLTSVERPSLPHVVLGARGVYRLVFHHPFIDVGARGADQITITGLIGLQL